MWSLDRRRFLSGSFGASAIALASKNANAFVPVIEPSSDPNSFQFVPDTLFLTWQQDPTTTITIQWLGKATTADMSIRYSKLTEIQASIAQTSTKPYVNTDLKVFRCEITGLTPGNEYKFQIGKSFPTYRFRTMPSKVTDEFRFVSGGDSGIDVHAVATNRLAALQNPCFVLMAGDLAYDDGKSPETFTQYLRNYSKSMYDSEQRMIPMLSCIGNHEVRDGYTAKREDSPQYLSLFDGLFSEKTYNTLDFGDYLSLVLLDTEHIEPIAGEQTKWLAKTLADRQDYPHLMVANHVPAYPSFRPPVGAEGQKGTGEDQRKHWSPLFEKHKVDVVLEHHDHTFKRTHPLTDGMHDRNGVVYLGDGSWGKLRSPKTPDERPYLAKVDQAYHMTVHLLQGETRFHVAVTDEGRVADVYGTYQKRPSRRG
jgi:acid phosphatase type 7